MPARVTGSDLRLRAAALWITAGLVLTVPGLTARARPVTHTVEMDGTCFEPQTLRVRPGGQYSSGGKARLGSITKAGDAYLRSLLVLGARAVMANLGDKQDRFSRWVRNLIERRGYWRTAIAIAAKNARMAWAVLKYGDDFRQEPVAA